LIFVLPKPYQFFRHQNDSAAILHAHRIHTNFEKISRMRKRVAAKYGSLNGEIFPGGSNFPGSI